MLFLVPFGALFHIPYSFHLLYVLYFLAFHPPPPPRLASSWYGKRKEATWGKQLISGAHCGGLPDILTVRAVPRHGTN